MSIWCKPSIILFNPKLLDEIFHIPAAQRYCAGNFSYWDPKITTPPGLYLYSTLVIKLAQFASSKVLKDKFLNVIHFYNLSQIECGVLELRATNVLLFPFIFVLLKEMNSVLYGKKASRKMPLTQGKKCRGVSNFISR